MEKAEKNLHTAVLSVPLPICIINEQGKIIGASDQISQVFLYDDILDGDLFALTGVKVAELYQSLQDGICPIIKRNDRVFKLAAQKSEEDEHSLLVFFYDITNLEELKDRYNAEKPCVAKIQIDNYDELISNAGSAPRLALSGEIDQLLRKWAAKINASVSRVRNSAYLIWFEQQYLERMTSAKFDILDEVRHLETGADFPASLSIGVGVGGKNLAQTEAYANIMVANPRAWRRAIRENPESLVTPSNS